MEAINMTIITLERTFRGAFVHDNAMDMEDPKCRCGPKNMKSCDERIKPRGRPVEEDSKPVTCRRT